MKYKINNPIIIEILIFEIHNLEVKCKVTFFITLNIIYTDLKYEDN